MAGMYAQKKKMLLLLPHKYSYLRLDGAPKTVCKTEWSDILNRLWTNPQMCTQNKISKGQGTPQEKETR